MGANGKDGINGADGKDGTGIKSVTLSSAGDLSILMTDNTVYNLGNIKGEKGDKGDTGAQGEKGEKGDPGADGRGIANMEIIDGELVVTYTDGTSDNLGSIKDSSETGEILEYVLLSDNTYGVRAGSGAKNSISITIPSTYNGVAVSQILNNGFSGLQSLSTITIPETVTEIGESAFYNCMNLSNLSFPSSLVKIDQFAFCQCYSLTSISIPEAVKFIGKYAFYQSGIKNVTFAVSDNWLAGGSNIEYRTGYRGNYKMTAYLLNISSNAASALRDTVLLQTTYTRYSPTGGYVDVYNYENFNWYELDWTHS